MWRHAAFASRGQRATGFEIPAPTPMWDSSSQHCDAAYCPVCSPIQPYRHAAVCSYCSTTTLSPHHIPVELIVCSIALVYTLFALLTLAIGAISLFVHFMAVIPLAVYRIMLDTHLFVTMIASTHHRRRRAFKVRRALSWQTCCKSWC